MQVHRWDLELVPRLPSDADNDAPPEPSSTTSGHGDLGGPADGRKRKSRWDEGKAGAAAPVATHGYSTSVYGPASTAGGGRRDVSPRSRGAGGRVSKYGQSTGGDDEEDEGNVRVKKQKKKEKKGEVAVERPLTAAETAQRARRANRFQKDFEEDKASKADFVAPPPTAAALRRAKLRVASRSRGHYGATEDGGLTEIDLESLKVVGTCQKLEKEYFRLTSAPAPTTVRPEGAP